MFNSELVPRISASDLSMVDIESDYTGPILAAAFVGDAILLAVGPDLHVSDRVTSQRFASFLQGSHIHGVRPAATFGLSTVWGPSAMSICAVRAGVPTREVACVRLADWPLDVAWLTEGKTGHKVAVAFTRHFVELWVVSTERSERLCRVGAGCFLFAAALHTLPGKEEATVLAGGTFDANVLVWQPWVDSSPQVLVGHQGAVFRVRFFFDASLLLSASDDRTVRLWTRDALLPPAVLASMPSRSSSRSWSCQAVMQGHGSRVWDAVLIPLGGGLGVASACEDSVVRLFSLGGSCLQELQGHQIRGVRCVEVSPAPSTVLGEGASSALGSNAELLSGGEDGAAKLWPLVAHRVTMEDRVVHRSWSLPDNTGYIRGVFFCVRDVVLVTSCGHIFRVSVPVDGAELLATSPFETRTSLSSVGMSSDASQLWCGGADGIGVVVTLDNWTRADVHVFDRSVCAAFGGTDGHGVFVDHVGQVALCRAGESHPEMTRLLTDQPRLGCAVLVMVGAPGESTVKRLRGAVPGGCFVWFLGDEHGKIHRVDAREVLSTVVHSDRVRSMLAMKSGVGTVLLSCGHDGTVVKHSVEDDGSLRQILVVRPGRGLRHLVHLASYSADDTGAIAVGAFRGADFVLWDSESGADIWRRRCGGAKRPSALRVWHSGEAGFVFASSSASKTLEVSTSGDPDTAIQGGIQTPVSLRAPLHGREVHAIAWLATPTASELGLFVTASEDTTMRLVTCSVGEEQRAATIKHSLAAVQHQGSVRALSVAILRGATVVFSAGAKGVLLAHVVDGSHLRRVWEHVVIGTNCLADDEDCLEADGLQEERVMAVDCVVDTDVHLLLAVVTSSGELQSWNFTLTSESVIVTPVARARLGSTALCMRCLGSPSASTVVPCVFVGSADGTVCARHLAPVDSEVDVLGATTLHSAGVNDIAIHPAWQPERLLMVTAGDDQQIALVVFGVGSSPPHLSVLSSRSIDNAHFSSVRALCWRSPQQLLSVGLDRRLHEWDLTVGSAEADAAPGTASCPELHRVRERLVSCMDPCAMAVAAGRHVLVSGRGIELFTLNSLVSGQLHPDADKV